MADFDEGKHPRDSHGKFIGTGLSKSEVAALAPNLSNVPKPLLSAAVSGMNSWVGDDYGYKKINDALREKSSHTTAETLAKITGLDTLFQFASRALKKDAVVYRGFADNPNFEVGKTYEDRGFQSTSANSFIAGAFMPSNGGSLLSIVARAGTRVFAPSDRDGANLESEVMLNRGTRFRILKVSDRNVHAEIVPPDGKRAAALDRNISLLNSIRAARNEIKSLGAEERLAVVVKHPDASVKGTFSDNIGA